jgi:hypothetical protein
MSAEEFFDIVVMPAIKDFVAKVKESEDEDTYKLFMDTLRQCQYKDSYGSNFFKKRLLREVILDDEYETGTDVDTAIRNLFDLLFDGDSKTLRALEYSNNFNRIKVDYDVENEE